MAKLLTFTVVSSGPNKTGGYVWKLVVPEVIKVFGVDKTYKKHYYIGGMPVEGVAGTQIVEDADRFEVKKFPFEPKNADGTPKIDDKTGEPIKMMLDWLTPKRQKVA